MSILQSAILGIIEGITEYLPISSTFHLIWGATILGIQQTDFQKAFEVIIQSGAILAVIVLYFQTVLKDFKLIKNLIYSFIPTAIIGLALYKVIKGTFFDSSMTQIAIFMAVGVLFLLFEKWDRKRSLKKSLSELTTKEAVIVGLCQAIAVFPGVSRAGAVMLSLMFFKINRKDAAKYSFLLAVPTLLSASVLDAYKSKDVLLAAGSNNIPLLLTGFIFSFLSAIFVVKWFISFLQRKDLTAFGVYRIALGIILLVLFSSI